eukprot:4576647-Alexandrium_andersonii.AAC.1
MLGRTVAELGTRQHHVAGGRVRAVESLHARWQACLEIVVTGATHVHSIGDCVNDHAALPGQGQAKESGQRGVRHRRGLVGTLDGGTVSAGECDRQHTVARALLTAPTDAAHIERAIAP